MGVFGYTSGCSHDFALGGPKPVFKTSNKKKTKNGQPKNDGRGGPRPPGYAPVHQKLVQRMKYRWNCMEIHLHRLSPYPASIA